MLSDMTVFMCIQKPNSPYNDLHGSAYVYWSTLPNGRRIEEGDWLVLTLTNKTSEGGRKVFGMGQVERIFQKMVDGRELSIAEYSRYREFDPPLTYDQIGGDPRTNVQHSMNRIPERRGRNYSIYCSLMVYLTSLPTAVPTTGSSSGMARPRLSSSVGWTGSWMRVGQLLVSTLKIRLA